MTDMEQIVNFVLENAGKQRNKLNRVMKAFH